MVDLVLVLIHPQFESRHLPPAQAAVRWYGLMYVIAFIAVIVLGKCAFATGPPLDIG
jgi:prolipoprotein diacylglyceryltransferase